MILRLNQNRFFDGISQKKIKHDGLDAILISDLFEVIEELICKIAGCDNEARYDSGYCSLHDMQCNDSKGKRIT